MTEHADLLGIDGAWTWDEDYRDAFANAVGDVVAVLDGETETLSSGEEATRSLEIVVGFYISHSTGGQVLIPPDRPLRDVITTSW